MTDHHHDALLDHVLEQLEVLAEEDGFTPDQLAKVQMGARVMYEALRDSGLLRNGVFTLPPSITVVTPTGPVTYDTAPDPVTRNDPMSNAERQKRWRDRHRNGQVKS